MLYIDVSLEGQVEFGKGREKLVRHILSKGLEVSCEGLVHGSWCSVGNRLDPGRGGNWSEMEHLEVEKEDRSLKSVECSGCMPGIVGTELQASDASPVGIVDFRVMHHGARPEQQR